MHSTKISGLAVDTEYVFHLVLRTTAGTYTSEKVAVRTHKMTDLSGITITTGIMPAATREALAHAVERIGAKIVDGVRIDTTHFVTTEGRGVQWEKAVEMNIPVVRPEWVEACEKNGRILGVTKFYLDAVRPPVEERTAPAPQTQKELPEQPKAEEPVAEGSAGAASQDVEPSGAQRKEEGGQGDEDEESSSSEDEAETEKVRSGSVEEQKVRVEERDAQNLAARPKPTVEDDEEEDEEEEEEEEKPPSAEKGARSPGDGASFQDVAL
jgi:hypothetical protein